MLVGLISTRKMNSETPMSSVSRNTQKCDINNDRATFVAASLTELSKLLNEAAKDGKAKEVSKLIANGASVHAFGPVGMNPLHLASMNGHLKVCKILLNAGVLIDSSNKVGKTALHLASVGGHALVVLHLLSLGAPVDPCDMLEMTPLHWACDRGHIAVVRLLLSYDADPKLPNKFHKTPLQLAAENKHNDVVSLIQDKKNMKNERSVSESMEDSPISLSHDNDSSSSSTESDEEEIKEEELQISNEELTPEVWQEEIIGAEEIEDITEHIERDDLSYENSLSPPRKMDVDEENDPQDALLDTLDKLEEMASLRGNSSAQMNTVFGATEAAELLRAQAALDVSMEDPSRMLRRAIYYGQTIQLTEAGERALAMIRPDPFIIPEEKRRKEEEEAAGSSPSSSNSECSAVVLRSKPLQELVKELSSYSASVAIDRPNYPPFKYKK